MFTNFINNSKQKYKSRLFIESDAGFTIIELLVVIAIIAALSAIVLVNVVQYVNTGKNASIKGNLSSVLTSGATYYESNDTTYGVDATTNFCTGSSFTGPQAAIGAIGEVASCSVNASYTAWCACSTMKVTATEPSGSTFCVDSTGDKTLTQNDCATECPAAGACQ